MRTRKDTVVNEPMRASKLNCILAALVLARLAITPAAAISSPLRFPMANEACPTSSFGSWRAGHLHAGLDFSTGGVTGVPVLAVDSCSIWRIRIWNGGYGKSLYAELPDGKTAVYGHLSRFIPEIETLVEARQDAEGTYEVELLFEADQLRFAPGDRLAYSGETGSGPPHLHFELRSGRDEHDKISPIPGYMDLAEDLSPVIKAIRIEPLGAESNVNGTYGPVRIDPCGREDSLMISGVFGVSVEAVDPVQCGRTLLPVRYEAWIDSVPVWKLELDHFPFAEGHLVGGLYEIVSGEKFVRLYDPFDLDYTGFTCLEPGQAAESGFPLPGGHLLTVVVGDPWGNSARVALPFVYGWTPNFKRFGLVQDGGTVRIDIEPDPRGSAVALACRSGGAWHPLGTREEDGSLLSPFACPDSLTVVRCRLAGESDVVRECVLALGRGTTAAGPVKVRAAVHKTFVEVTGETASPPSSLPVVLVNSAGGMDSLLMQPAGTNLFRSTFVPPPGTRRIAIETEFRFGEVALRETTAVVVGLLEPGREVCLAGDAYEVRLKAPESYSSRSFVGLSESQGETRKGFGGTAGRLALEPSGGFFGDLVEVTVTRRQGGIAGNYGVFAENAGWVSLRGRFDETGRCRFSTRQPESLVILEDRDAPRIDQVKNFARRAGDGKAVFTSRVTDTGAGVDAQSLRAFVDGQVAIVSIDPDTGLVGGRSIKALPSGEHRIRLEAEDRMGNKTNREFTVVLSR